MVAEIVGPSYQYGHTQWSCFDRAFGHQNNVSHYEYRYILVGALLEYTEVPQPLQPVGHPNDVRHAHWPEQLPKSNKNNQTKIESVSSAT